MNYLSSIVLLVVVSSIANYVQTVSAIEYCTSQSAGNDAENVMKKCNSQIKNCFIHYQDKPVKVLYCRGMMKLLKCAFRENRDFNNRYTDCRSAVLDEWMFVVLQYVCIGHHLGACTDYNQNQLDSMKDLTQRFERHKRYQGRAVCGMQVPSEEKGCASKIHAACAPKLVTDNGKEQNLCKGVKDFLTCYKQQVDSPPSICADKVLPQITRKFNELIQKFSSDLINRYEKDAATMCHVRKEFLDANPC